MAPSGVNGQYTPASISVWRIGVVPQLGPASTGTRLPALVVVQKYTTIIQQLIALIDVTGQGASDATLGQAIRVLGLVSRMKEQASQQRAILTYGLLVGHLSPTEQLALNSALSDQQGNLASFNTAASTSRLTPRRGTSA